MSGVKFLINWALFRLIALGRKAKKSIRSTVRCPELATATYQLLVELLPSFTYGADLNVFDVEFLIDRTLCLIVLKCIFAIISKTSDCFDLGVAPFILLSRFPSDKVLFVAIFSFSHTIVATSAITPFRPVFLGFVPPILQLSVSKSHFREHPGNY